MRAPFAGQKPFDPAALLKTCLLKLISEPVFDALPLIFVAVYLQVRVPTTVVTILSVALGLNTVTGLFLTSPIVVRFGSLVTVTVTLLTRVVDALQPVTVSPVSDWTAVPGRAGFAVTLLVMVDFGGERVRQGPGGQNSAERWPRVGESASPTRSG